MRILRIGLLLASAQVALTGGTLRGEAAAASDEAKTEPKESGYTITVEFDVDSAGSVTNAKVVRSEAAALDGFALSAALDGRLNPQPLPAPGSEPKHVSKDVFYPVDAYDSGKPLPAGVEMPRPVFQPSPAYPFEYRKKKITGGAWLAVTVDTAGTVTDCKTIRASNPDFGPAAEQAVARWKFKPAMLHGQPVEVTFNVPLSFQIGGEPYGWRWLVAPAPAMAAFIVLTNVD
jgi:TonB family protein